MKTFCFDYGKKLTLCGTNCNVKEGQGIEKSNCLSRIERVGSVMKRNQRRTRDREPSRVRPVRRVLKALKRKLFRQKIRSLLTNSVPKTLFIRFLCCNYKYWYERENYLVNMSFSLISRKYAMSEKLLS